MSVVVMHARARERPQRQSLARADDRDSIKVTPAEVGRLVAGDRHGGQRSGRDLLLQTLLHLPRVASADGDVDAGMAREEVARLRALRAAEMAPLRRLTEPVWPPPRLQDLTVEVIDRRDAEPIIGVCHYLRSFRGDSVNIGVTYNGRVAALCSISPLDLPRLAAGLPVPPAETRVISRVFAFDWAPKNVVSFLLARVERYCSREKARLLVTYLNPNLGFSGASYRASNWVSLGMESGTRYAYVAGLYVTDREVGRLAPDQRARVEYSRMRLEPLTLLCRPLDRALRRAYPHGFGHQFAREPS